MIMLPYRTHITLCAQHSGDRFHQGNAKDRQNNACDDGKIDQQRELLSGLIRLFLSQRAGYQRAAAGTNHKPHNAEGHQIGPDDVDGSKGKLSHIIGDKKAVYHRIDGSKDHHGDGGKIESKQTTVSKMVRELDTAH